MQNLNAPFIIATYNVAHCKSYLNGNADNPVRIEQTADAIQALQAQIVGLNEIYCNGDFINDPNTTLQDSKLACLAQFPYHAFAHACTFGKKGEDIGNAILSKTPIFSSKVIPMYAPSEENRYENERGKYFEDRAILAVETMVQNRKIAFLSTHFGLNLSEQENIVKALVEYIDECKLPLIITGDFNVPPDHPVLAPLYERLQSAALVMGKAQEKTFATYNPRVTIDYIFVSKELEVIDYEVVNTRVSDHFPIKASVRFRE